MAAHHYAVRRWLAVEAAPVPLGAVLARPSVLARAFARAGGADEAAVRADIAALAGHLAEVERLRSAGVIGCPEPNAADFQIAGTLRSLEQFADLAPYLEDHPAVRWAATVVPPLPGPVPSVLPREWLRPLERSFATP
jgi:glutathione S-transferase